MGEVFAGRYELIDPIASGGMGTVWRVLDRADGKIKAAKMLRQADAAMLLRFVREQSVRISHDHVVTPQSWAGVDDRVLFTMPLVRGGSVADLLRRHGPLPPYWIGQFVDQTLQALEAVHAAGVVHRDIKPANLLLEPTGVERPHLRVTDFGIAVPADEPRLTQAHMVVGTPGYMAPEQYRGADPDPASDIYAVGLVALEMLTGRRPPSDGPPPPIDLSAMRIGDPAHDDVVDVIAAATTYDAAARASATRLRHHPALQRLLALPRDRSDGVHIVDDRPPAPATDATATDTRLPATAALTGAALPSTAPFIPASAATPRAGASARGGTTLLIVGAITIILGALLLLL